MSNQSINKLRPHYFYGGPFSQWIPCAFIDENNVKYNCAEQYMMAQKALLMKDSDMYFKIMAASDPFIIKYTYGRNVKNFDNNLWDKYKFSVVFKGNLFKFTQNTELCDYIKKFKDHVIVESSPTDTIWGIGLSVSMPEKVSPGKVKIFSGKQ